MSPIAPALNTFALDLYKRLPSSGNLFFSPFSVSIALAILMLGAKNETASALAVVLHLNKDLAQLRDELRNLLTRVSLVEADDWLWDPETGISTPIRRKVFELRTANGIFPHSSFSTISPSYSHTVVKHLGAELTPVDFSKPGSAADTINQWVALQTNGLIDRMVAPDAFSELTRLVLVNTVYFFAEWQSKFEESATCPEDFHVSQDKTVEVDMMHDTLMLAYLSDARLGAEVVALPYKEADMLVLLPHDGKLEALEQRLDTLIESLPAMTAKLIALSLPKFNCDCALGLDEVLQSMGLGIAFDPDRADFSGITDDPAGLNLSAVLHQARIRVDENGTEAAAATLMAVAAGCSPEEPPQPYPFVLNRPFLYLIRDRISGAILFAGRITDPSA